MPALRWWRELALMAAMYGCYTAARSLNSGGAVQADRDGWAILTFERAWHLAPEMWLNDRLQTVPLVAVLACYVYATLHFVVTPGVLVWTYRSDPSLYVRARTTLALTTFGALLGFWLFPTAPPRLLTAAGFHDTLQSFSTWGWWGSETSLPTRAASLANDFAAMPSLHVGWSVWCAATLVALMRRRSTRVLAVAYPIVTTLVVLATANHYLLDALAGAAVWALADACVRTAWVRPPLALSLGRLDE